MDKLSAKQEAFCREYLVDLNGTRAAIRAGYSEKTAEQQASRLLTKVKVKEKVAELKAEVSKKTLCTVEWVVNGLMEEAQSVAEDSTSSSRVSALKALSDYTGDFDANRQKLDVNAKVDIGDRLQRAKERARR